ncbi:MAG: sodium:panthothenate symporter, partial [Lentisphaeria bacterium]|nr:sodium:panthothenate symporter [Lentisphaeria bacterium]
FLASRGWAEPIGKWLEIVSAPFNPYVVWKMDPVKFPINSYEIYLVTMLITLAVYCSVSLLTWESPFNLDRMLHRGIYSDSGEEKKPVRMTFKTILGRMVGITSEYTRGDRVIAWGVFWYSFVFYFLICFVTVVIWNLVSPWPTEWWGIYFFIKTLLVPCAVAFVSTFWFGIGGAVDLVRLFRDLEHREADILDNGQVEGSVSLADRARFDKLEAGRKRGE